MNNMLLESLLVKADQLRMGLAFFFDRLPPSGVP